MILLWIALTNGLTNAITGLVIGLGMYFYGKRQGEKSKEILKDEIKTYIKDDLFHDLKDAITKQVGDTTKGIFGPFARSVNGEIPEVARQWANENPGVATMLMNIAKGAAMNKMAKALGVPKEVKEYIKMLSTGMMAPQQTQQAPTTEFQFPNTPDFSSNVPQNLSNIQKVLKQ